MIPSKQFSLLPGVKKDIASFSPNMEKLPARAAVSPSFSRISSAVRSSSAQMQKISSSPKQRATPPACAWEAKRGSTFSVSLKMAAPTSPAREARSKISSAGSLPRMIRK